MGIVGGLVGGVVGGAISGWLSSTDVDVHNHNVINMDTDNIANELRGIKNEIAVHNEAQERDYNARIRKEREERISKLNHLTVDINDINWNTGEFK